MNPSAPAKSAKSDNRRKKIEGSHAILGAMSPTPRRIVTKRLMLSEKRVDLVLILTEPPINPA